MKNRLVGLLVFALVAFNLYAQSDQSKKGLLTFTGTRIISFDPMREMPKMAWYSENQDIRVDEEVLFNNQSSLLIPSVRGKKTEAFFAVNDMYLPLSPTAVLKLVADDKLQFQIRDRVEGFSEWENELKKLSA